MMMRTVILVLVAGTAPVLLTNGADSGQIGILPSDRRAVLVAQDERNPFAKVEEPKVEQVAAVTEDLGEEGQIVAALGAMKVGGRVRSDAGWKILFGEMILEKGMTLPPVIVGQTQQLRVLEIYDTVMEVEWLQGDSAELPKRLFIPIELTPSVRFGPGGVQSSSSNGPVVRAQVTQGPQEGNNAEPPAR